MIVRIPLHGHTRTEKKALRSKKESARDCNCNKTTKNQLNKQTNTLAKQCAGKVSRLFQTSSHPGSFRLLILLETVGGRGIELYN